MGRMSLSSDSHGWWMPAGVAGLVSAALISLPFWPASWTAPAPPQLPTHMAPVEDVQQGYAHIPARDRCPLPPNTKYVGGPWVSNDVECATSEWWRMVPHGRAGGRGGR